MAPKPTVGIMEVSLATKTFNESTRIRLWAIDIVPSPSNSWVTLYAAWSFHFA